MPHYTNQGTFSTHSKRKKALKDVAGTNSGEGRETIHTAVKRVIDGNAELSIGEILATLKQEGFDFGTYDPEWAVQHSLEAVLKEEEPGVLTEDELDSADESDVVVVDVRDTEEDEEEK
jgi:hypothetical protein